MHRRSLNFPAYWQLTSQTWAENIQNLKIQLRRKKEMKSWGRVCQQPEVLNEKQKSK